MLERVYDTLRGILFYELPKNAKGEAVIFDRPVSGFYIGEAAVRPNAISIIFKGASSPLKDISFGLQEFEHNVSIEINSKEVPILEGAVDMAKMGIIPAGMYRNKEYVGKDVELQNIEIEIEDILYDPQTSGGLLVSVKSGLADMLVEDMKKNGSIEAKIIGEVKSKGDKYITVI